MRTLTFKIAGVTFEGRQEIISLLTGKEAVRMLPEPENAYDKNAIAIEVSRGGEISKIGYVPRELAKEFAPALEGEPLTGEIFEITGGFEKWDGSRASYGMLVTFEIPDAVNEENFG